MNLKPNKFINGLILLDLKNLLKNLTSINPNWTNLKMGKYNFFAITLNSFVSLILKIQLYHFRVFLCKIIEILEK